MAKQEQISKQAANKRLEMDGSHMTRVREPPGGSEAAENNNRK